MMTQARADAERGEDLAEGCPDGALRLPWLHVRPAPLPERRPLVPGCEPVEEERAADQDEGGRSPGTRQQRAVARDVRDQLNACCAAGLPTSATAHGCRPIGRSTTTSMTVFAHFLVGGTRCGARHQAFPRRKRLRRRWCPASSTRASGARRVPRDEASRKAGCGKSARPV